MLTLAAAAVAALGIVLTAQAEGLAGLVVGYGAVFGVAGGAGVDVFQFYGDEAFAVFAKLDRIVDWETQDKIGFDSDNDVSLGAGTAANYVELTAGSYDAALAAAGAQMAGGTVNYVSVQVGGDVFFFADSLNNNGAADSAVMLVGRTLNDISFANIVVL